MDNFYNLKSSADRLFEEMDHNFAEYDLLNEVNYCMYESEFLEEINDCVYEDKQYKNIYTTKELQNEMQEWSKEYSHLSDIEDNIIDAEQSNKIASILDEPSKETQLGQKKNGKILYIKLFANQFLNVKQSWYRFRYKQNEKE